MTRTKTIYATLGSKLVTNAASFFRNDPQSILEEVVQNARRAGATSIDFEAEGKDLVCKDDGTGLPFEDADVLLSLGSSALGGSVERDEAAAGIGFFSLAHHVVHVRTQDWRCTIRPEAFVGREPVQVEAGLPDVFGMEVRIEDFGDYKDLAMSLAYATQYSGLTCSLHVKGGTKTSLPSNNFMDMGNGTSGYHASRVARLPGASVRVVRWHEPFDPVDEMDVRLNFHGKTLMVTRALRHLALPFPALDFVYTPAGSDNMSRATCRTVVLVDVEDTRSVRLRLPDRDTVVDEPRLATLAETAVTLFKEMLQERSHGVESGRVVGLSVPTTLLLGAGRDASDLFTHPSSKDPSVPTVVDEDGLDVDHSALVRVPSDLLTNWYLPHAVKMKSGRIVRLVDDNSATFAGLGHLPCMDRVTLELAWEQPRKTFDLLPFEDDMFHEAFEWVTDQIDDVEDPIAACKCEAIRLSAVIGGEPALVQSLPFLFLGDPELEGPASALVLVTPRAEAAGLASVAEAIAMDAVAVLYADDPDLIEGETEKTVAAWQAATMAILPNDKTLLALLEERLHDVFLDLYVERNLDLDLRWNADRNSLKISLAKPPKPKRKAAPTSKGKNRRSPNGPATTKKST